MEDTDMKQTQSQYQTSNGSTINKFETESAIMLFNTNTQDITIVFKSSDDSLCSATSFTGGLSLIGWKTTLGGDGGAI